MTEAMLKTKAARRNFATKDIILASKNEYIYRSVLPVEVR
jgi:hypothetical protein